MKIQAVSSLAGVNQWVIFCIQEQPVSIPDANVQAQVNAVIQAGLFTGKDGEILPLIQENQIVILAGLGEKSEPFSMRKIGKLTKTALKTKPIDGKKPIAILPPCEEPPVIRAIVDGAKLGLYKWDKYITPNGDGARYEDYDIRIMTQDEAGVNRESLICDGVNLARDLANENADIADSELLEKTVREIAGADARCSIRVLNGTDLQEHKLNLHLAVNQGSQKEPKLIIVTYQGGDKNDPFVALVGKGITFDTGGLNLKPTGSMETMRMDMCGTAAVIGTLRNAIQMNLKGNVYFVCAIAENAIGSRSYKPGDVIRGYCGKTVEIANTDAEGRLVLADANSYMARNYQPEAIINIATLTGAVVIALGYEYTGVMASHPELAQALLQAAEVTDDRAWQLPMYPELAEHVKSQVADIKNTGEARCAGTLAGGEFLRQFAQCDSKDQQWAHLDIAGTSKPSKDVGYFDTGATGAGVRLFTQFLMNRFAK